MNGMKNYLVKLGEADFQNEVLRARSMLKSHEFLNLDAVLETVMHQLVVLPLREHLYGLFVDYYTGTGDIQLLVKNVKSAIGKSPLDFGIRVSFRNQRQVPKGFLLKFPFDSSTGMHPTAIV